MSYSLFKAFAIGMLDYIARHNSNYTTIEAALNSLATQINTVQGGQSSVPIGLQEIFDRRGLIGVGSYDFNEATLSGPDYNLTIQAGSFYNSGSFYHKGTSSTVSFAGRSTGTYYINIDSTGIPVIGTNPDGTTTRSLSWNASTHVISAKTIYASNSILFDGDDWADILTSTFKGVNYTKAADRFEAIEQSVGDKVQVPTPADTINIDWSLGSVARIVLNRATTTINCTNGVDGRSYVIEVVQDGVGGRAIVLGTGFQAGTDYTVPIPIDTDLNKITFIGFRYSGQNSKCNYVSLSRGY